MSDLPAGTVTFLFTDIEGSTRLLADLKDEYADVLAEHRSALRDAFTRHGGVEVDTHGDAFFVAFARARDAIAAAVAGRDALSHGPVRVRMGIHTGEPLLTEHGYVGLDVHRAARIAAAGHGGQILISQATRDLVGRQGLRDLGQHRLRDLTAPEQIYQVGDAAFPPLKTLNRTNLPVASAELIGRARELAELQAMLVEGARLVTITGAGGSGKTRLALQVAADNVDAYPDGVFFVGLAALGDPDLVGSAAAHTAGAAEIDDLRDSASLLILDNFEHLLSAAPTVSKVLSIAPRVRVIVTSRIRLNLSDEREFPLDPLEPDQAIALFLERGRAFRRDMRFEPAIGEICRRLDGLPLALELAASRLKALDAALLLERIGRRLPLLTRGARDVPKRHQTLRATIEWSYELLEAPLQDVFRRLSVFAGSFSLDAAESIVGVDLDATSALVDWSLLKPEGDGRFHMLETIREFSRELLEQSDEFDDIRDRHLKYVLALVLEAEPHLTGPDQRRWYDRLALEHDNVRAALAFACGRGDGERALMLAGTMWRFWWNRGYTAEAAQWYERALEHAEGASVKARARGAFGLAHMAESVGDVEESRAKFEHAAVLLQEAGETRWLILALTHLAGAYAALGDAVKTESLNADALKLAEQNGDLRAAAIVKSNMAGHLLAAGEDEHAVTFLSQALDGLRAVGDTYGIARSLTDRALIALRRGNVEHAGADLREAIELSRSIGDTQTLVYTLALGAATLCARGELAVGLTLAAADETLRTAHHFDLSGVERAIIDAATERARTELGASSAEVWRAGAALDVESAISLALSKLVPDEKPGDRG